MPAENQPGAYIHAYIRNWYTIYNSDIQSTPSTFKNRYTSLVCWRHQVRINRDGQLQNPFEEKIWQEIWIGIIAQLRAVSSPSFEASPLNKISLQTKINLASAKGSRLVLKPWWTSRAIFPPSENASSSSSSLIVSPLYIENTYGGSWKIYKQ